MSKARQLGDTVWAMHRPALEALVHGVESRGDRSEEPGATECAISRQQGEPIDGARRAYRIGSVGVLPVIGAVRPRGASLMDWLFGARGFVLEHAALDLQMLVEDRSIGAIVLDVSSPGGMAEGVQEFAEMLASVRGRKPLQAYVGGMGASAAYWVAAACDQIVVNATGECGSIGVVATYMDFSKMDERIGIQEIEFVSSQSPNKRPDIKTAEGAALIQRRVDDMAEVFVRSIAQYRGVGREDVVERFGAGDVMVGQTAVDAGLADQVGSFDEVLSELSAATRRQGMALSESAMKTLKSSLDGVTADELRTVSPELVDSIETAAYARGQDAGKASGIEEGKKQGEEAGMAAERERLAAIDEMAVPGAEEIIKEAKADASATAGDVARKIVAAQRAGTLNYASAVHGDAPSAVGPMSGDGPEADSDPEQKAADAAADRAAKQFA